MIKKQITHSLWIALSQFFRHTLSKAQRTLTRGQRIGSEVGFALLKPTKKFDNLLRSGISAWRLQRLQLVRVFFCFSFFVMIVLSSCGISYSSQEADPYRTGTEGIVVSFIDDDYTFYDQQYLLLQLLLENKGVYDAPQGKVVLSGYDPTIVKISADPIELPDDFTGKNQYAPQGSSYFVQVEEDAPVSLSLGESYDATLQASLCYTYQTIATPTACLLYNPEDTYICDQETISLNSQGGPVAVTEVRQDYLQDQVRFTVFVQHLGDGSVVNAYDVDAYDACPFTLTRDDLNHVGVTMEIGGLGEPSCIPGNGYIALNDEGLGVIICTFTLREQRTYTTPLKITLDYSYLSVLQQDISIYESSSVDRETSSLGTTSDSSDSSSSSSGSSGSSGSSSSTEDTGCPCSDANMRIWGGCVCLYVNGKMEICKQGENQIQVSGNVGDIIEYQVHGSSPVTNCGDSSSPTSSCPFTGTTTVPKKLSIYGTVNDGRIVSERCSLVIQ
ncbi:MAG: hypothetical protein AABX82_01845 [Nanoarchaeota archaeon]